MLPNSVKKNILKMKEIFIFGGEFMIYNKRITSRFFPGHNHYLSHTTAVADGHVHQVLNVTYPPRESQGSHIHYITGYVLFEDGHYYRYEAWSGPAEPSGNTEHVHAYDFYTTVNNGHQHHFTGTDSPAPGTR
jgi:hypothetical protein